MYSPKFVVSIMLMLHISIAPLNGQWNNAGNSSSNFQVDKNINTNNNNNNDTNINGTANMRYINGKISNVKLTDRMAKKLNDTDDNDEFHFLVTGGYRPETNALVKFVVSLRTHKERKFFGDNHFCGGAIISSKIVLTAAHCLYIGSNKIRAQRVKIVAGTPRRLQRTSNSQEVSVDKIKPHPKYSSQRLINDIGLIRLKEELKLNYQFVAPIALGDTPPAAGMQCTVIGWGTVMQYGPSPDEVVNGDMAIRENSYCARMEGFTRGMLCASDASDYEVDSCQGDSGGPLICQGKVVGIVSYGYGCGEPNSAGVYTDVNYFRKWINDNGAGRLMAYDSKSIISIYKIMLLLLMIIRLTINAI